MPNGFNFPGQGGGRPPGGGGRPPGGGGRPPGGGGRPPSGGGRPPGGGGRPPSGGGRPPGGFWPPGFPPFWIFPNCGGWPCNRCDWIDQFGRCCDRNGWCCDQYGRCGPAVGFGYGGPAAQPTGNWYGMPGVWDRMPGEPGGSEDI